MNFKIKKEFLLHYLLQIQKILPQKTFFPIYHYIKLTAENNCLFLEVNNMYIAVKLKLEDPSLVIEKEGSLIVLGKYFIDIVKKLDYFYFKMAVMENQFLIIKTDSSEYKLKTIYSDNFPRIDFVFDFSNCFEISSNLFKEIIKETNIATSKDKQKIIFTGVNLIYQSPFLMALATDSFRLSQKKVALNIDYPSFNITIPNKSLEELIKLLEQQQKNEKVYIKIDQQKFFLKTNFLYFQSPLLEGNYPQLPTIKKENYPYFFQLNKNNLIKILERVALFSPKENSLYNNIIEFKIYQEKRIQILSQSEEIGNASEEMTLKECSLSENNIHVSFNGKYLEEILKVFDGEEIIFSFENSFKPFIIHSNQDSTLLYLISPFYK